MTEEDARFRVYLEEHGHDTSFMGAKGSPDKLGRMENAPQVEKNANDIGASKLDNE